MSHKTPRLPSSSQYQFSLNPSVSIPRCSLVRPFSHKTTIDSGYLYPLYVEEVLPGDTFTVDAGIVARLATPLVPFMDNIYLDMQFFYVPYRLVWDNFVRMHGQQDNPDDSINYTMPQLGLPASSGTIEVGSLSDYLGLPTGVRWRSGDIHSLVHRAYNLIWNEWFRDQNVQDSVTVPKGDGPDAYTTYSLLKRNKRKDYFTSALPWPQKGNAVSFSLNGTIPVYGNGKSLGLTDGTRTGGFTYNNGTDSQKFFAYEKNLDKAVGNDLGSGGSSSVTGDVVGIANGKYKMAVGVTTDASKSGLVGSLANISTFTVNEMRTAFQIQKLLEQSARGGTRYTELLYSMFGVQSPDSRLQRPELLGTFTIPVSLNTVAQTSGSEEDGAQVSPQGNLAAFALASGMRHCFNKSFVEYGVVIGLCSIRCDQSYQQGIPRMYSRNGRFDFYYPVLAHLGEQAILNKEIYAQGTSTDDEAFGYQERWSEYKYSVNRITGQLRSTYAQSLDFWHLAQKFDSLPTLGSSFVEENPPISRVVAVTDAPQFVVDSYFHQRCVRPMPLYCIPGLVDHF